jgi:hypothetical protein
MARKTVFVSDLSGKAIEEGKGAKIRITFDDAGGVRTRSTRRRMRQPSSGVRDARSRAGGESRKVPAVELGALLVVGRAGVGGGLS